MKRTIYAIIFILLCIVIYDVYIIFSYGNEESISAHILSMGEVIPQIVMLLGYTMGHLTIPRNVSESLKKKMNVGSYLFFLIVGTTGCYDVYQVYFGLGLDSLLFEGKEFHQAIVFLPSYALGGLLWGMPKDKWQSRFKK